MKISMLLGVLLTLFFYFSLSKNLTIRNLTNNENKELFFKNLLENFNDFFEIKQITLNGRSKSNLDSIKNTVNSSLHESKNIIKYDIFF